MADAEFEFDGETELHEAIAPSVAAMLAAARELGEAPAGFALVLPLTENDMYVAGGMFGRESGDMREDTFRILAEGMAMMLEADLERLGPLLAEVFERLVRAAGGKVETMHFEAPDTLPEDEAAPESPMQRWTRRRRG